MSGFADYDTYYDDDSSNGGGLASSIISSLTTLGSAAIIANQQPNLQNAPLPQQSGLFVPSQGAIFRGGSSVMSFLLIGVFGFIGYIAWKKLAA